jgi:hypothetical protein
VLGPRRRARPSTLPPSPDYVGGARFFFYFNVPATGDCSAREILTPPPLSRRATGLPARLLVGCCCGCEPPLQQQLLACCCVVLFGFCWLTHPQRPQVVGCECVFSGVFQLLDAGQAGFKLLIFCVFPPNGCGVLQLMTCCACGVPRFSSHSLSILSFSLLATCFSSDCNAHSTMCPC